jgi:hypothetical protein
VRRYGTGDGLWTAAGTERVTAAAAAAGIPTLPAAAAAAADAAPDDDADADAQQVDDAVRFLDGRGSSLAYNRSRSESSTFFSLV